MSLSHLGTKVGKVAFIQLYEMNALALLKGVSDTVGAKSWRQDTKQMQKGKATSVICTHPQCAKNTIIKGWAVLWNKLCVCQWNV